MSRNQSLNIRKEIVMYRTVISLVILVCLSASACSTLPALGSVETPGVGTPTPAPLSTPSLLPSSTFTFTLSPTSSLPTPSAMVTVTPNAYVITTGSTNVRTGPGILNPHIDTLQPGEKALAIGTTPSGDWIKIIYPHGPDGVGWVYTDVVALHAIGDLPVAPEAQSLTAAPTVQASPEELAAIRAFNPAETMERYRLQKSTVASNVPNLTVDIFHVNGVKYEVDPLTMRVVEFVGEEIPASTDSPNLYTSDQLEAMAARLVVSQVAGIDLKLYTLEANSKGVNYSFRWSKGKPGESGYATFIQVVYWLNGKLFQYVNALL